MGDATPFAVRVTRRVGRHWLVGGGFSYFSSEAASSASASYRYTVVDPKAQEYQREFAQSLEVDPLVLEVRDYFPHGLVGYDVGLGSRLRLGGTLAAGWSHRGLHADDGRRTRWEGSTPTTAAPIWR